MRHCNDLNLKLKDNSSIESELAGIDLVNEIEEHHKRVANKP